MTEVLVTVALVLACSFGYYAIFFGGPELLAKGAPNRAAHVITHAERKFPKQKGMDAMRMLIATRLGIAACILTVVCIAAGSLWK